MSQSKYFVILSHSFPSDICHSDRNNVESRVEVGRNEAAMENEKKSQVQAYESVKKGQSLPTPPPVAASLEDCQGTGSPKRGRSHPERASSGSVSYMKCISYFPHHCNKSQRGLREDGLFDSQFEGRLVGSHGNRSVK